MAGKQKTEAKKELILGAAAKVFAEKGFYEGTIPDIARECQVSDASIYDHFSNKENLLFTIPLEAMAKLREALEFHLKLIRGPINKIRAMLQLQFLFFLENRDVAAVFMLILKQNIRFLDTDAHKSIRDYIQIMDQTIEEGMNSGEFRSDLDPYIVRCACLGTLEHMVTNWLMLGNPDDDQLLDLVDPMIDILLRGIRKEPERRICPLEALV